MGGMGISVISTSKGIMSDKGCRRDNIGGEVLCMVS
jgi:small subunit ribosomal protein S8